MAATHRHQLVAAAALLTVGGSLLALVYLAHSSFYPLGSELAVFGSAVVVGTFALVIGCRWQLLLGRRSWTAVGVGAVASVLLSYFAVDVYGCCLLVVHRLHRYPFGWLDGQHTFADWLPVEQALAYMERHPEAVTHTFSALHLVSDLVFWAYVLIVFALVSKAVLRAVRRPRSVPGRLAPRVAYQSPGRR